MEKENTEVKAYTKTVKLRKAVEYDGEKYEELTFEFGNLTGNDGLAVEAELRARGMVTLSPLTNGEYIARIAVKACTAPIGIDIFGSLSLFDAELIKTHARNFFMGSE